MAVGCLNELLKLQELDLRLRDLELRLKTMPQEMKNMIARRDKINKNSVEAAEKVKSIELSIRQSESEAGRLEEENARLLQQSSKVKKQAEYDAMLLSIDNNKKKIAAEEENTLLLYDLLETAKANYRKVKKDNDDEIKMRFSDYMEFGTGGLRAKMGAGTNMMNTYTVAHATEGVARLIDTLGDEAKALGVIIGRDSRNNSDVFARRAAAFSSFAARFASFFCCFSYLIRASSAFAASSIVTCVRFLVAGFIVVSQSCSALISPSPL